MNHQIHTTKLANGATLVVIPMAGATSVTSIVLMNVGSRYENDQQRGLAHFTEHMVFKGGSRYTTAKEVAQALDAVGGEFNAFTSQEFTGFYTKTAVQHTELGLDVLSDMLLNATFPASELEKEKGVIVEEINMYEDMPMRKVDHVLMSLVFGDTPLGLPIIGSKESVTAFTRDDFVKYRDQFYHGDACTIVVAGGIEREDVAALAEKYFGALPSGQAATATSAAFIGSDHPVKIEHKQSEQTHLMLAAKGFQLTDPRRYAYRLMVTILGGNMSSRLFTSVREEQGLCYYVRASADTYVDAGMVVASAGVDNNRLPQAVEAIVREESRLKSELVDSAELNRAKQFLFGKMALGMEDSEQVAEFYGMQQLLERNIETVEEIKAKIEAVTAEEIQAIAQEVFQPGNMRLAIIGPHSNHDELASILTLI